MLDNWAVMHGRLAYTGSRSMIALLTEAWDDEAFVDGVHRARLASPSWGMVHALTALKCQWWQT